MVRGSWLLVECSLYRQVPRQGQTGLSRYQGGGNVARQLKIWPMSASSRWFQNIGLRTLCCALQDTIAVSMNLLMEKQVGGHTVQVCFLPVSALGITVM